MTAAVVIAVRSPVFGHFEARAPMWTRMARSLVYLAILGVVAPTVRRPWTWVWIAGSSADRRVLPTSRGASGIRSTLSPPSRGIGTTNFAAGGSWPAVTAVGRVSDAVLLREFGGQPGVLDREPPDVLFVRLHVQTQLLVFVPQAGDAAPSPATAVLLRSGGTWASGVV